MGKRLILLDELCNLEFYALATVKFNPSVCLKVSTIRKYARDIKKELKRLETIDNSVKPDMQYYEKRSQALEIIKEKDVDIKALKVWNKTYKGKLNYQNYLGILKDCDLGEKLSQEEFDLLKEVLL